MHSQRRSRQGAAAGVPTMDMPSGAASVSPPSSSWILSVADVLVLSVFLVCLLLVVVIALTGPGAPGTSARDDREKLYASLAARSRSTAATAARLHALVEGRLGAEAAARLLFMDESSSPYSSSLQAAMAKKGLRRRAYREEVLEAAAGGRTAAAADGGPGRTLSTKRRRRGSVGGSPALSSVTAEERRLSEDDATIFVSIAQFMDVICPNTVMELFKHARNPRRVFIGLVDQRYDNHQNPADGGGFSNDHDNMNMSCNPHRLLRHTSLQAAWRRRAYERAAIMAAKEKRQQQEKPSIMAGGGGNQNYSSGFRKDSSAPVVEDDTDAHFERRSYADLFTRDHADPFVVMRGATTAAVDSPAATGPGAKGGASAADHQHATAPRVGVLRSTSSKMARRRSLSAGGGASVKGAAKAATAAVVVGKASDYLRFDMAGWASGGGAKSSSAASAEQWFGCADSDFCPSDNIRVRHTFPEEGKGPTWGRYMAMLMYQGESYYMMIDSHSRFVLYWDLRAITNVQLIPNDDDEATDRLIERSRNASSGHQQERPVGRHAGTVPAVVTQEEEGRSTGGEEAKEGSSNPNNHKMKKKKKSRGVLSHYPGTFESFDQLLSWRRDTHQMTMCNAHYNPIGIIRLDSSVIKMGGKPILQPFAAAGFVFGDAAFVHEVPFDPYLYYVFDGEEVLYSVRLWTHGWNLYTPVDQILFHHYKRHKAPRFWNLKNLNWAPVQVLGQARVKYIMEAFKANSTSLLVTESYAKEHKIDRELEKYGLGNVRTLDDYYQFAHINKVNWTIPQQFCEEINAGIVSPKRYHNNGRR